MFRCGAVAVCCLGASLVASAQAPKIDSITPSQGPIAGGTIVTVAGTNFVGAAVTLDRGLITPLSQSDSQVRLLMPSHDNGYALVQIGSAAVEFLYIPPRLEDLPPGYITTVAGVGKYLRLELPATQSMVTPWGIAPAPTGDIYFVQASPGLIFRVSPDGILHHVAGTLGTPDFSVLGDGGPARDAIIWFPRDVARDAVGNLYVNDSARFRIRRIDAATGIITTIAGTGTSGFSGDGGPATQANIIPNHLTVAPDGTVYSLDNNLRVRKITPTGIISTVAGNGTVGDGGDGGPAISAQLNIPASNGDAGKIALDANQNIFVLELDGQRVRRIDGATGIITTFASSDTRGTFSFPNAMAIDSSGNVYVATRYNIDKFSPGGQLLQQWFGAIGFSPDGTPASTASFGGGLGGMAIAANGDILYSDNSVHRLRKINMTTGLLETLAGMGPNVIGVPGPALGAVFVSADGDLAFLPSGDLIFADADNLWVYRINLSTGTIVPFGGTGTSLGAHEETPALEAGIAAESLVVDSRGTVYFADKETVRSIDTNGIVHRVAGLPGGQYGFSGDGGPARDALLCQPNDAVLDRAGNIFIADTNNNRIRRVDAATGIITTVAGSGPSNGFEGYGHGSYCGDGGPALSACFNTSISVALLDDGTMYVNDFGGGPKIRKIAPSGIVSTLNWPQTFKLRAGPGQGIYGHGGAMIYRGDGNGNFRVIVGTGVSGFSGDGGPASQALMAAGEAELAQGLAIDAEGNLFFHDAGNRRIRAIRYGAVIASAGSTVAATAGTPQSAFVGQPFPVVLEATVLDSHSHPANGVRVDFAAPASGASCTFAVGGPTYSALTDVTGRATAICTANSQFGAYSVSATPLALGQSATFALANNNPAAQVSGLVPASALAAGPGLTLTVYGSNYLPGATVMWNGSARTTTFVNSNTLTAQITGSDLFVAGMAQVSVSNPGATASNAIGFRVSASPVPDSGCWWDPNLSGIGFFLEYGGSSGNGLFGSGFLYDASGNATWLVSTGPMSGSTYNGTWLKVTGGQTLTGPYKAPNPGTSADNVSITFSDSTHGVMTRPDGSQINIQRFSFTSLPIPAPEAGAPQVGWWWGGSALSGTGYGIEIQGSSVFILAYVYDGAGNPVWYLATGSLTTPTTFSGTWDVYAGGPQLTGPEGTYPVRKVSSATAMSLTFSDATHGMLTMGAVTVPITRFQGF